MRIFINLIDNAIKYTPEGGSTTIGVDHFNKEIRAFVSDTGIGIAEQDSIKVFERFVHIDQGQEILIKGAGLGLSICKSIIEMHGGKIRLESKLGSGSKFSFNLPRNLS